METKLQGIGSISHFCITPNNQQFHKPTLHFPKTNHIDISLTGTDTCNSKLSNKKYIQLLFSIFQKNLQENYSSSGVFWKDFAFV